MLDAISEFDKAMTVAKLRGARERKRRSTGKCEGRKSHAERNPELVALVRQLRRKRPKGAQRSLRDVSAELAQRGIMNERGQHFSAASINSMLNARMELAAKRIELLREVLPDARRIGLVSDALSSDQIDTAARAARSLGFVPLLVELTGPHPDYAAALRGMGDAQAVVIPAGPLFMRDRLAIAEALTQAGIPSICAFREIAEAGALMSYGVDLAALFRDMADYVDRIAKGSKPADLPIEHATRFHMAINLRAAARLGVSVSNAFAARANEVIE